MVSAGVPGDAFEPRHTTHGFQYVRVEGHPGPLTADDVTGVVVHTDLRRTGWFACSDERLEPLHEAAVWSFRGNACDIPTDCPSASAPAWTGDWQLYVPTAAFLYDVAGFSAKWLRDLAADQRPDGAVRNIAPDAGRPRRSRLPSDDQRLGRLGRRRRPRAVGAVPGVRRRRRSSRELLADDGGAGSTASSAMAARGPAPRRASRRSARAGAARAVPVGHRLPLGRVARAGRRAEDFPAFIAADKADVATAYFA